MQILRVARRDRHVLEERWLRRGVRGDYVSDRVVLDVLSDPLKRAELLVDAIAIIVDGNGNPSEDVLDVADAAMLMASIRGLADDVAMIDGRKWKAIPVILLAPTDADVNRALAATKFVSESNPYPVDVFPFDPDTDFAVQEIRVAVRNYRQRVLDELDDLGHMVSYERGRYRVKPAMRARHELNGHYYFGAADRRPERYVTVDRDIVGIQAEVDKFEALINRPDVSEAELQEFFDDHPHFFAAFAQPLAHVRLEGPDGKILIPDFILRPLVAIERDSRWQVMDLKTPQVPLLVGKGARRRLSHEVMKAIAQLREYGDYFSDQRNADRVEARLGHRLRRPKLGVLIGRWDPREADALEREQSHIPDVKMVTYDEILEEQRIHLT